MSAASEGFVHPEYLIETEELAARLGDPDLVVLDSTTHLIPDPKITYTVKPGREDFEKGHIPGARHVALSQFDPENKELAKVRDLPVAVYCKAGTTSAQAATRLVKAGFKHVFWLGGGLAAWQQADLPVVKGK